MREGAKGKKWTQRKVKRGGEEAGDKSERERHARKINAVSTRDVMS